MLTLVVIDDTMPVTGLHTLHALGLRALDVEMGVVCLQLCGAAVPARQSSDHAVRRCPALQSTEPVRSQARVGDGLDAVTEAAAAATSGAAPPLDALVVDASSGDASQVCPRQAVQGCAVARPA